MPSKRPTEVLACTRHQEDKGSRQGGPAGPQGPIMPSMATMIARYTTPQPLALLQVPAMKTLPMPQGRKTSTM